jgi:hypothetical protein
MVEFISIGPYCDTTEILKLYRLRMKSYPFDWIFSSLKLVYHCISDQFHTFLDKKYLLPGKTENATRHSFYNNFLDTELLQRRYLEQNVNYKPSEGNLHNHHDLINNKEQYNDIKRRCHRFLEQISHKTCLVYFNCYTTGYNDIIKFAENIQKYDQVFVLGILENDLDKEIVFTSPNCKIYQNYPRKYIFQQIQKDLNQYF